MSRKTVNIVFLSIFFLTLIASPIYSYIYTIREFEREPHIFVYIDFVIILFIASFVLLGELFIWRSTVYLFYSRQRTMTGIIINVLLMGLSAFEIVYAVYSLYDFYKFTDFKATVLMTVAALTILLKLIHCGIRYGLDKRRARKQTAPTE